MMWFVFNLRRKNQIRNTYTSITGIFNLFFYSITEQKFYLSYWVCCWCWHKLVHSVPMLTAYWSSQPHSHQPECL